MELDKTAFAEFPKRKTTKMRIHSHSIRANSANERSAWRFDDLTYDNLSKSLRQFFNNQLYIACSKS